MIECLLCPPVAMPFLLSSTPQCAIILPSSPTPRSRRDTPILCPAQPPNALPHPEAPFAAIVSQRWMKKSSSLAAAIRGGCLLTKTEAWLRIHTREDLRLSLRDTVLADPIRFYAILGDDGLSASQKELAARLYSALKAIANWLVDLEAWIWIESFAQDPLPVMPADQLAAQGSAMAIPPEIDMWESLPSSVVDQYEWQLDSIFKELDRMALDELKEMDWDIHQGNSRPSSSYSTFTESKLAFLDDFSFFVTSVMLQILPQHARLKQRLHTWSIRISVLHLIPGFLEQIRLLRLEMDRIWPELAREVSSNESSLVMEQNRLELLKASAQARMSYTGRILDDMLDLLEGQSDVLPVKWIDGFESLENDLSSWTLASERRMFRLRSANGPPLRLVSPIPSLADVTQSSSPIPAPSCPAASTLEGPDLVIGPDLLPTSSLVIPAPESYPKIPSHMNTLEHENTAPMDVSETVSTRIVSAKEES